MGCKQTIAVNSMRWHPGIVIYRPISCHEIRRSDDVAQHAWWRALITWPHNEASPLKVEC